MIVRNTPQMIHFWGLKSHHRGMIVGRDYAIQYAREEYGAGSSGKSMVGGGIQSTGALCSGRYISLAVGLQ